MPVFIWLIPLAALLLLADNPRVVRALPAQVIEGRKVGAALDVKRKHPVMMWLLGATVVAGAGLGSPALVFAGPIGIWQAARVHKTWQERRRSILDEAHLLGLVDQLVHELRSGNSLASAFVGALDASKNAQGPTPSVKKSAVKGTNIAEYHAVVANVAAGERLEHALERSLEEADAHRANRSGRSPDQSAFGLLAIASLVLTTSGGPALPAMQRLSETLRLRQAAREETNAQASQATASAVVLAALPALFGCLLMVADHRLLHFYASTVPGALCITGSLLMVSVGWAWINRMVWS